MNNNGHKDPAADGARGARLDNCVAWLTDEIRRQNQNLAMEYADSGDGFNFAAAEAAIASLEAELQDALEAIPGFDWSEAPAPAQHLRYNPDTETFTICDGARPARS